MTDSTEVEAALKLDPTPASRILYFGALLARESGSEVVIVGGSAIEVHSRGKYASGDIDLRADRARVARVLRKWGFRNPSRMWVRSDWGIFVDIVGDKYSGDAYRYTEVVTPYGRVGLAVPEDLIVKRLARIKHWKGSEQDKREDLAQAKLLWDEYRSSIDLQYLALQAASYDVVDLLEELKRS